MEYIRVTKDNLEKTAKDNHIPLHTIHISSKEEAQDAPTPVTTYALFYNGEYITNEQLNVKKFLKLYYDRSRADIPQKADQELEFLKDGLFMENLIVSLLSAY